MRLHLQSTPWDLYAMVGYTAIMAAILLLLNVGNLLAILLVLFVPGYVIVAALFPGASVEGKPEIDWVERLALSFGLSVAVVPVLGLLLNFTPFGIRLADMAATIALFTAVVGSAAFWRRMRLPVERRLSLTVNLAVPDWGEYTALDKALAIGLAASIVVGGGTLAYVILTPRTGETFTEFYIIGPGGNATRYPKNLTVNETASVVISIVNDEGASVNYALRVDLVGVVSVYNASAGYNQTVTVSNTTWTWRNVTVANGATWMEPYSFSIPRVGLWKVQFLLFRAPDLSNVYRRTQFYVTVT